MYKTILLAVYGYKTHVTKKHSTLAAAKRYLLDHLKPAGRRPAWIYQITTVGERKLPGQYEVWPVLMEGHRVGLYHRSEHPNRLNLRPLLTKAAKR